MTVPVIEPIRFEAPLPRAKAAVTPKLITTAQLCGELSRITESREIFRRLPRAGREGPRRVGHDRLGGRPVRTGAAPGWVSLGYAEKVVARMGGISRDAGNAVAAAYRSGGSAHGRR